MCGPGTAPSTELRTWFHAGHRLATLLYALRDTEHNHAQVLAEVLGERLAG